MCSAVAYALFLTLAMRFVGAFIFGRHRRPLGQQAGPDARHPVLFGHRRARGLFPEPVGSSSCCASVRHRDGGRMGARQFAGDGIDSAANRAASSPASCNAAIRPAFCSRRSPMASSTGAHSATSRSAGERCSCSACCPPSSSFSSARGVPESPAFEASRGHEKPQLWATIAEHKGLVLYMVVLMMCFNLFSHGTQDLYPTFLQKQHNFDTDTVSWITIVANLGAIVGGLIVRPLSERSDASTQSRSRLSSRCRRCRSGPFRSTPVMLALGAFVMQIAVQGAWGVIPAHLNELSPGAARATIPAFVYQAGNFLASYNGPFQAQIAEARDGNYGFALAIVAGMVAVAIMIVIRFSPERRGEHLHAH